MVPMPKSRIATEVQDFVVLPLQFPATKAYPKEATHYLYLRQNAPRIPTPSTPRELFLVNVPIDATVKDTRLLFAEQLGGGRVEDVEFEDAAVGKGKGKGIKAAIVRGKGKRGKKRKRGVENAEEDGGEEVGLLPETWDREVQRSGGTAVVRFVDQTSAGLALKEARKAVKTGRMVPWESAPDDAELGSARYKAHHTLRYPDPVILQESTDAYMTAFAAKEAETARQLARQRMEPDEDGFITVTRGGRNGPARPRPDVGGGGDVGAAGGGDAETGGNGVSGKNRKKHKGHVEEGFYRFQVRERKKREHGELARKFEEDARRVEQMRRRRGRVRPEG